MPDLYSVTNASTQIAEQKLAAIDDDVCPAVTLRTKLLQVATKAREVLRPIRRILAVVIALQALCPALVIIFVSILGIILSPGYVFFLCCLPALFVLAVVISIADWLFNLFKV